MSELLYLQNGALEALSTEIIFVIGINNFVATAVSASLGIVEISGLLFIGLLVSC